MSPFAFNLEVPLETLHINFRKRQSHLSYDTQLPTVIGLPCAIPYLGHAGVDHIA